MEVFSLPVCVKGPAIQSKCAREPEQNTVEVVKSGKANEYHILAHMMHTFAPKMTERIGNEMREREKQREGVEEKINQK